MGNSPVTEALGQTTAGLLRRMTGRHRHRYIFLETSGPLRKGGHFAPCLQGKGEVFRGSSSSLSDGSGLSAKAKKNRGAAPSQNIPGVESFPVRSGPGPRCVPGTVVPSVTQTGLASTLEHKPPP